MSETRYSVYVIDLLDDVLENRKIREANPGYIAGSPCVYVGSTAHTPEERFTQHRRGGKLSNKYVHRYGLRLRNSDADAVVTWDCYFATRTEAEDSKASISNRFREAG
jgi:hypothetical protein